MLKVYHNNSVMVFFCRSLTAQFWALAFWRHLYFHAIVQCLSLTFWPENYYRLKLHEKTAKTPRNSSKLLGRHRGKFLRNSSKLLRQTRARKNSSAMNANSHQKSLLTEELPRSLQGLFGGYRGVYSHLQKSKCRRSKCQTLNLIICFWRHYAIYTITRHT